jgi:hypothetical protein
MIRFTWYGLHDTVYPESYYTIHFMRFILCDLYDPVYTIRLILYE